jgi:alpha 1,2-mannosyltransferase
MRYLLLVLGIIISLHYILSFTHEGYGQATSLTNIKQKITSSSPGPHVPPYKVPLADDYHLKPNITSPQGRRANATIVMLGEDCACRCGLRALALTWDGQHAMVM